MTDKLTDEGTSPPRAGETIWVRSPDIVGSVPNQPKTPLHSFRVNDELWDAARDKAQSEGTTIADVLRAALKRYINRPAKTKER